MTRTVTVLVFLVAVCTAKPLEENNPANLENDIVWDDDLQNYWEPTEQSNTNSGHDENLTEEDTVGEVADNITDDTENITDEVESTVPEGVHPLDTMPEDQDSVQPLLQATSSNDPDNSSDTGNYTGRIWHYKTSDNAGSMTYTIPYDTSRMTDPQSIVYARIAMKEWSKGTCILFVPRTTESDFISIRPGNTCSSHVGRVGGEQFVTVSPGCQYDRGLLMHELGHVLGLFHEHTRTDRDKYVEIIKENLIQGYYDTNFKKMTNDPSYVKPGNYDYLSVMHYGRSHFSKPPYNLTTIRTVDPAAQSIIGQRTVLSSLDVEKVNTIYNCDCKIVNTTNTYTRRYWGECSFLFITWRCVKEEEVTEILSKKMCIDLTTNNG